MPVSTGYLDSKTFSISGNMDGNGRGEVPLTTEGRLQVATQPYLYAIAENAITGHSPFVKIGYHPATTGAQTTLWNVATEYAFPAANISVEAVSSSAADNNATGTGAKTVHLTYLTSDHVEKSFTFTMTGTSAVVGPTDFFRVNTFHVKTAGAGQKSAGVISLRLVGGAATVYSQMPVGSTRARNSVYTVPAGKVLYIANITFSAAYSTAGKSVRMTLHATMAPDLLIAPGIFYPIFEGMIVDGNISNIGSIFKILPKSDIKVSVIGETNAICTSTVSGWLEEE